MMRKAKNYHAAQVIDSTGTILAEFNLLAYTSARQALPAVLKRVPGYEYLTQRQCYYGWPVIDKTICFAYVVEPIPVQGWLPKEFFVYQFADHTAPGGQSTVWRPRSTWRLTLPPVPEVLPVVLYVKTAGIGAGHAE